MCCDGEEPVLRTEDMGNGDFVNNVGGGRRVQSHRNWGQGAEEVNAWCC